MPEQPFNIQSFLIAVAVLILFWSVIMLFHKRGLKNDKKKLDKETKTEINRLLDLDESEMKIS